MTRNNPSPSGLRGGLETPEKKPRNRTRKQPVKAAPKLTVSDGSDSEGEVATMSQPPTQIHLRTSPFRTRHPNTALSQSIEPAESRAIAPLPARRHNTRSSSRSVSPSLLSNHLPNGRNSTKSKGKGRARSTSTTSSTQQVVEASKARGGKRKVDSEDDDGAERQTSNKRAKAANVDSQPIKKATGAKKAGATKNGGYMSRAEKNFIRAHFMSLPVGVLEGTVKKLIKADRQDHETVDDFTFELDIDNTSTPVLWKIHGLIVQYIPDAAAARSLKEKATQLKDKHIDPADQPQPATRKRNLRSQIAGSPIVEVDEEEEDARDNRVTKRARKVEKLPQEELQFSYEHINTPLPNPPQPAEEQVSTSEPSTSRTPQSTSKNSLTITQTPARADSPQCNDSESKVDEIAEGRATHNTSKSSTSQPRQSIEHSGASSKPSEIAEQRAVRSTPNSSTPQQSVIARTDAQSNGRHSVARENDQERSASTPPLPTLKNPHPARPAYNDTPSSRQGLPGTRVAQGSSRSVSDRLPSNSSADKQAYLQKRYGAPRTRVLNPETQTVTTMGPVHIFEDSEPEDDENQMPDEDWRGWKSDFKVARSTFERVLAGGRLPEAEPSTNGTDNRITRCKPGERTPALRSKKSMIRVMSNVAFLPGNSSQEPLIVTNVASIDTLRAIAEWEQSSETNTLPSKEEMIGFLQASKSDELNRVRSSAPSPASQPATPQRRSAKSTRNNEQNHTPRVVMNRPTAESHRNSEAAAAAQDSEMEQPAGVHEPKLSIAKVIDEVTGFDSASENASEVDPNEALPSTPTPQPPQRIPESRAWSVFNTVKSVVSSPFKFLGITAAAGAPATTNSKETEFTFTHSHKPNYPPATPTRSDRQRANPQSERRASATMQRRVSKSPRAPQTERQRRHGDRSTPIHLRGCLSEEDRQRLYGEQAAARQRQREEETANLEQEEPSHGKTYRAPESDVSSDSDDDEYEEEEEEVVNPGPRPVHAFLNYKKPVLPQPELQQQSKHIRFLQHLHAKFGPATLDNIEEILEEIQNQPSSPPGPKKILPWNPADHPKFMIDGMIRDGILNADGSQKPEEETNRAIAASKAKQEAINQAAAAALAAEDAAYAAEDAALKAGRTFTVPDDSSSESDDSEDEAISSKNGYMSPTVEEEPPQVPPPKPRPGNAHLPRTLPPPTPLHERHRVTKPSGLRNVTQMSPLQQAEAREADKENQEVDELLESYKEQGEFPEIVLPETTRFKFPVPPEFEGKLAPGEDNFEPIWEHIQKLPKWQPSGN